MHQLELDCAPLDGGTSLETVEDYRRKLDEVEDRLQTDTLCAVDSVGQLAASAWVTCDDSLRHEYRVFLDGRVHPDYRGRGLGSFILRWMEARGQQILSQVRGDRPGVLRIDFHDRGDDAVALFKQHGFQFAFAEDEMRRELSHPLPDTTSGRQDRRHLESAARCLVLQCIPRRLPRASRLSQLE